MIDWEWFNVPNTCHLFMYLIMSVEYKDIKYHGKPVRAGSGVYTLRGISAATGLSVNTVKKALDNLQISEDISVTVNEKNHIITIKNFESYQELPKRKNDKTETERKEPPVHTDNEQPKSVHRDL